MNEDVNDKSGKKTTEADETSKAEEGQATSATIESSADSSASARVAQEPADSSSATSGVKGDDGAKTSGTASGAGGASSQTRTPSGPSVNPEQVENTATVASYVVGAITGLMYLLAHRDKAKVRFHASRSILITVVIVAAWILVSLLGTTVAGLPLVIWAGFAFLIYMAVMTFKGSPLKVPFLNEYTQKFADWMSPNDAAK